MKFAFGFFLISSCSTTVPSFLFPPVRKTTTEPRLYFQDQNLFKMCLNSTNIAVQIVRNLEAVKCIYLEYLDNICQTKYSHAFGCEEISHRGTNTPEYSLGVSTPVPDVTTRQTTERVGNEVKEAGEEEQIEISDNCVYIFGGNNTIYLNEDEADDQVVFIPSNSKVLVQRKSKSKAASKWRKIKKSKSASKDIGGNKLAEKSNRHHALNTIANALKHKSIKYQSNKENDLSKNKKSTSIHKNYFSRD